MYHNNLKKYLKNKPNPYFTGVIFLAIIFFGFFSLAHSASAKTFYLDGNLSSDCTSGKYSIANRDCSGSDGDAYKLIEDAETNLASEDTLYVRSGQYSHATTNSYTSGILHIPGAAGGTISKSTIIEGYQDEYPEICAYQGHCNYPPTPSDRGNCVAGQSLGGGACYYPNPAVDIQVSYVTIKKIKTYGNIVIGAGYNTLYDNMKHNILIEQCDIGGAGMNWNQQANAITIQSTKDIIIKNNKIHEGVASSSYESSPTGNAYLILSYNSSNFIVENNNFYNAYGGGVFFKDRKNQPDGNINELRNNFFSDSTSNSSIMGFRCCYQYTCDNVTTNVHHNVFYHQYYAIFPGANHNFYNNTFINTTSYDHTDADTSHSLFSYNNLYYHSTGSSLYYYFFGASSVTDIDTDYNGINFFRSLLREAVVTG